MIYKGKEREYILSMEDNPEKCAYFGCGKTLSIREKLFGNYCINHQDKNSKSKEEMKTVLISKK